MALKDDEPAAYGALLTMQEGLSALLREKRLETVDCASDAEFARSLGIAHADLSHALKPPDADPAAEPRWFGMTNMARLLAVWGWEIDRLAREMEAARLRALRRKTP